MDVKIEAALDEWIKRRKYLEFKYYDEVAREMGVTKEQLGSYCTRYLHKDFRSWRKELRIGESQRMMMEDPSLSLSDLSVMTGFNDKSNFSRAFYECTGLRPSEWRERYCRKISR